MRPDNTGYGQINMLVLRFFLRFAWSFRLDGEHHIAELAALAHETDDSVSKHGAPLIPDQIYSNEISAISRKT